MSYWTVEMLSHLYDAPWPATKWELIDYAKRSGVPVYVIESLYELEDDDNQYELDDFMNDLDLSSEDDNDDSYGDY